MFLDSLIHKQEPQTPLHPRPLKDLFPNIAPYSQGFLAVDILHTLYWEQSGNPDGIPVLILHGGPGAGATATHRRFFDPQVYRIIVFDQRGAGRSHALGNLENNTLQHLVTDMETLRKHLNIERWHLFGGSWGSTLALAYAIRHPERCIGMILRSIFLMESREINWFMYGMKTIFPEAWDDFANYIPKGERDNLLDAYCRRLNSKDDKVSIEAALAWNAYETACASFIPTSETVYTAEQKYYALATAKIEAHYFSTQILSGQDQLLHHIDRIRSIPATIVHGRYDILCPIDSAHRLHMAWPEADYVIVPDSGHSFLDPTMRSRLIEATETAKNLI